MKSTSLDIGAELSRLEGLTNFELRSEWRRLHGMQPPKSLSRDLLLRGIIYKIRERAFGGLSKSFLRRLSGAVPEVAQGVARKAAPAIVKRGAVQGRGSGWSSAVGSPKSSTGSCLFCCVTRATRDALMTGRDATIDAMAQRLGVKRDYLSAHIRLTYLAPDVVRALVSGRYPPELTPARLLSLCKNLPHDWQLQCAVLGFETR